MALPPSSSPTCPAPPLPASLDPASATRRPLAPCRPGFADHVFRTVAGIDLPLRVWPAAERSSPGSSQEAACTGTPWLLWFHGGGSFAGGKWSAPTAWVTRAFCERGYVVVSVGYRLLPDVTLSEIVDDCVAAHAWCLRRLGGGEGTPESTPEGGVRIDPRACVVGGASAGATAATLLPFHLARQRPPVPVPAAVVNVYGMVDVLDPVHHLPLPFPVDPPVTDTSKRVLEADLHVRDPRRALTQAPWQTDVPPAVPLDQTRAHLGMPRYAPDSGTYYRIDLVNHMVGRRIMLRLLLDATDADDAEFRRRLAGVNPLGLLDAAATYPPTFMLHGTGDLYVPVHEAEKMAARLRAMGVDAGEVYPEGAGHCFDWDIESPSDAGWKTCIEPLMGFVDRHARRRL